jgi:hypothetical protein
MRLDDLIREGLAEEAGRARFDALRWAESIVEAPRARVGVRLRRAPRPPRRWVAVAAVAAVVLAGIGLPLAMLWGLFGADRSDLRPAGSTVTGYGLSLELPAGWEGGVAGPRGSDYGPFLQAANHPLAPPESDPFATTTRRELAHDDVTLVLIEYTRSLAERGLEPGEKGNFPVEELPISIREEDFQSSFEGVSDLHDFARRTFTINGRSFDLWVEFGQKPAPGSLVSAVDEVLATLRVEPPAPPPGYVTHTDAGDGLAITIPQEWSFSEDPTDPIEPENVLAAGSWAFPEGGVCAPFAALDELPSDGAFFWLIEYHGEQHPEDFVPRPDHFDFADFRYGKEFSCYGVVPQYQLRFDDQGRFFQLQVAFGPEASAPTRADMLDALDSIRSDGICDVGDDGYVPEVMPASGVAGTETTVTGEFPHGEPGPGGYPVESGAEWVEVWWNLDPSEPGGWSSALPGGEDPIAAEPGPVFKLGRVDVTDSCTYELSFEIPDMEPGVYPIVVLYMNQESAASFQPAHLEVTG